MTEESPTLVSLGSKVNSTSQEEGSIWYGITTLMLKQKEPVFLPRHIIQRWDKNSPSLRDLRAVPCSSSLTCLFSHQKLITHHHHTLWQDYAKLGERRELTELVSFSLPAACWKGNEPCGALPRLSHHLEPLLHCRREGGDTYEGQELWWADNNILLTLIILVKMRLCGYRMYATYS